MSAPEVTVYDLILAQGKNAIDIGEGLAHQLSQTPHGKYAKTIQTLCHELIDVVEALHQEGAAHPENDPFWSQGRHRLRSPLSALQGYAEILAEELPSPDTTPLKNLVDISRRLLPLINSIHSLQDLLRKPDTTEGKNYNTLLLQDSTIRQLEVNVITTDPQLLKDLKSLFPAHHFRQKTLSNARGGLVLVDGRCVNAQDLQGGTSVPGTWRILLCPQGAEKHPLESKWDGQVCGSLENPQTQECLGLWIQHVLLEANNRDLATRLRHTYEVLGGTVENLDDAFVMTDTHDRLVMCNTLFKRTYPYLRDLQLGEVSYEEFLQRHMAEGFFDYGDKSPQQWFQDHLQDRATLLTTLQKLSDGRWLRLAHNRASDGSMTALHADVTHEKQEAEQLTYLANHDDLTHLPNRAFLEKRGAQILETTAERGLYAAVLYFDLDGFKHVNDTQGHPMGDALLVEIADRVQQSCRSKDAVARLGGDEFAVILGDLKNEKEAFLLAKRVTKDIGTHFIKEGTTVTFAISMGLSLYPTDAETLPDLLFQADQAMYHAKRLGKGRLCAYREMG